MFRAIWSQTLRQYRIPTLCWGIGLALILIATFAGYTTQVTDAASRAGLARLTQSFRFFGEPVATDTAAGYVTWRLMGLTLPVLVSIWSLLAGARLVRSEEERGAIDLLLSTPRSRMRLLLEKLFALIVALIIVGALIGSGALAGQAATKGMVNVWRALLAGLNVSLIALFFASLALLLSQFLGSRGAAGWTGVLLALSVLLDGTGRVIENGVWLQRFSPLHYYGINKLLIDTYPVKPWAPLVLLILAVVFGAASALLFRARDIGMSALPAWQFLGSRRHMSREQVLARAEHEIANRSVGLQALRAQAVPTFWWLLALAAYTAWTTLLTPSMLKPLQQVLAGSPLLKDLLSSPGIATNAAFLSFIVFQFASVIAVVFAFNQALRWSTDLDRGHMELVLATPRSRVGILLERFGAVLLTALMAPLLIWLVVSLSARAVGLSVDPAKVAAASLSLLPMELIVAAFVYALAERLRAEVIVGIVSAYLALAFFVEMLRTLLNLPEGVLSLSLFHAYGSPLSDGWHWGALLGMLGVAGLLLLIGALQFRQSDIERGA